MENRNLNLVILVGIRALLYSVLLTYQKQQKKNSTDVHISNDSISSKLVGVDDLVLCQAVSAKHNEGSGVTEKNN